MPGKSMPTLEKTYLKLISDSGKGSFVSAPSALVVTVIYIIVVLSGSVQEPQKLIWLDTYPIVASEILGMGYSKVLVRSLWILPPVIIIGMFNPFIDTTTAFSVGGIQVSKGWVSFISIILRGLLAFQAVIILVMISGILDILNSLKKIGCPTVLITQLILTYRYLSLLIEEVITMKRARLARGFGKKSYPLKMWAQFVGQLLLRSATRAQHIHRAMLSRGFTGSLPTGHSLHWSFKSIIWLSAWTIIIILLRFIDFSGIILKFNIT